MRLRPGGRLREGRVACGEEDFRCTLLVGSLAFTG
jgi:hypothetical protein